jgi:dihydrofolate reductase
MGFSIIAALDSKRGIGHGGKLPWNLKGDLGHFQQVTTAEYALDQPNACIMGLATWKSLPERARPLPKRLNIVLSFAPTEVPDGVINCQSLDEAIVAAAKATKGGVFVIGGGSVYAQAVQHQACVKLYLTEVEGVFECDTYFPELPQGFRRTSESEPVTEGAVIYRYVTYEKA